jgi:hypothetical protein
MTPPRRSLSWPPGVETAAGLFLALVVAGCGAGASTLPIPTVAASPTQAVSASVMATASAIDQALSAIGLASTPAQVPFRPGESPTLAAAPRMVVQAILPNDPVHGMIVIYDFADAGAALAAGNEMAGYLRSGPGRVQFVPDSVHTLRQVGSSLVFFTWSPANSPDPRTADIATALQTLGTAIPIVR